MYAYAPGAPLYTALHRPKKPGKAFPSEAGAISLYARSVHATCKIGRCLTSSRTLLATPQATRRTETAVARPATTPGRPIMQYIMLHDPGQTPRSHRRRFFAALGHGVKWIHFYHLQPASTGGGDFCDGVVGSDGFGPFPSSSKFFTLSPLHKENGSSRAARVSIRK